MRLDDTLPGAGRGARFREMQFTGDGLVLGEGTVLAKMNDEGLRIDEDRVLTCLALAFGRDVPPAAIGALQRAVKCWRDGDKALAAIHLAQIGLRKIDGEDAHRLSLAAKLIDGGVRPRDLARELGLIQSHVSKYSDNQPPVPAGNGRASGQWANGDAAGGATAGGKDTPLVEGRSAGESPEPVRRVHEIPKDAVAVTRPDGTTVDDPKSPTRKLMAPPKANFREIYAAGRRTGNLPRYKQYDPARLALHHFGTYDFQRDEATNRFFDAYIPAANYAVGVYMAGAGYGLGATITIARLYSIGSNSTNKFSYDREWTRKGWQDATDGHWR